MELRERVGANTHQRKPGQFLGDSVVRHLSASAGGTSRSLAWEDPTCHGAIKPVCHSS